MMTFDTSSLSPSFLKRPLAAAALGLALAGAGHAQDVDATKMIGGGLAVIQLVDNGKAADLWEGASPAVKRSVTRDDFVNKVTKDREALGAPQQRTWVGVSRQMVNNPNKELSGQYLSVEYETRFAKQQPTQNAHELVSFRLDTDGIWRVSGYALRMYNTAAAAPAAAAPASTPAPAAKK